MAQRTVVHAALRYQREITGPDGEPRTVPRLAYRGDVVDLDGPQLERFDRLGAVVDGPLPPLPGEQTAPQPAAPPTPDGGAATQPADPAASPTGDVLPRPARVEAKGVWVEYAVSRGMDRDEAAGLTKDDLIARLA